MKTNTNLVALPLLGLALGASALHAEEWPPSWFWPRFFDESNAYTKFESRMPALNLRESAKEYFIDIELPGMRKEDISITFQNGMLTITGERRSEKKDDSSTYRIRESSIGKFSRSLTLPNDADPNQVSAEFKDGLLTVKIVRNEALGPKKITIK
jgi:HSP20 family protein